MTYRIALNFEDGVTRLIHCEPGEKVLDAAYRQQVHLPMDCADGVCGTCKCRCEQGQYHLGDEYLDEALTAEEAAAGLVLTCQMVAEADCVLSVPLPASACKTAAASMTASIAKIIRHGDAAVELHLNIPAGQTLDFLPGQYMQLGVPGSQQTRAYSFSTRPGAPQPAFLIRHVPGGLMSSYLQNQAEVGASLQLSGPQGSFYLRPPTRPLLLLAGGTGIAPLLSMLETLAETACPQQIRLLYGVTRLSDLVLLDRLDALSERLPDFTYATCVSDRDSGHPKVGHVTDCLDPALLQAGEVDIYLCGPPPMVDAVQAYLREHQLQPSHFYYEKFTPSTVIETGQAA